MGRRFALALLALALAAAPCPAQDAIDIHFSGCSYESGGFWFSESGDTLVIIGRITSIDGADPTLPYDPDENEYTLAFTSLISLGEEVDAGVSTIVYEDGTLSIYQDPSFNADTGEAHEANEPPPSFVDGELWLRGPLPPFTVTMWRDLGMGVYSGYVTFTDGLASPWFTEEFTWGGTLVPTWAPGCEIGTDAEIWVESVSTSLRSLGAIKALY